MLKDMKLANPNDIEKVVANNNYYTLKNWHYIYAQQKNFSEKRSTGKATIGAWKQENGNRRYFLGGSNR